MTLSNELERELAAVRADPVDAIGLGDTSYLPYVLRRGEALQHADEPKVTTRLASAIADRSLPRVERLALLQIVGLRDDPAVDGVLIKALADPTLRPLAAYLLGRAAFKGYPKRTRDARAVLTALAMHLNDSGRFDDPWYQTSYHSEDLILAAFVRVAGPDHFDLSMLGRARAEMIGYELTELDDVSRASLRSQCQRFDVSTVK